jgi:serine protease Do
MMERLRFGFLVVVLAIVPGFGQSSGEEGARRVLAVVGSGSYLGVGVREIDQPRARELRLAEEAGVEVTQVDEDSPASKAGLKVGDVVLEYNGQRIEGSEQFVRMVRETPVGRVAKLKVSRGGTPQTLNASIGQRKAGFPSRRMEEWSQVNRLPNAMIQLSDIPRPSLLWSSGMLGIEAEGLASQLAEHFGVKEGVLVRHVHPNLPAAKAGLKAGDVLLRVNDTKVTSPREVTNAVVAAKGKGTVSMRILRNRNEMSMEVEIRESEGSRRPSARPVSRPQEF